MNAECDMCKDLVVRNPDCPNCGANELQEVELEFCSLGNRVRFKIRNDVIDEIIKEADERENRGEFDKEPYDREYWVEKEIVKHIMDDVNVWFPPFHP